MHDVMESKQEKSVRNREKMLVTEFLWPFFQEKSKKYSKKG